MEQWAHCLGSVPFRVAAWKDLLISLLFSDFYLHLVLSWIQTSSTTSSKTFRQRRVVHFPSKLCKKIVLHKSSITALSLDGIHPASVLYHFFNWKLHSRNEISINTELRICHEFLMKHLFTGMFLLNSDSWRRKMQRLLPAIKVWVIWPKEFIYSAQVKVCW